MIALPINTLNYNEQLYYQLVQDLPAAIYTCDINGYVKLYNKAAAALWGREPEIGKDLWCGSWKIYKTDGSELPLDQCPMALTLKEKRAINDEEIIVERPDGQKRNVLPHPKPIFDNKGVMIGAVNMLVDITDNKLMSHRNVQLHKYNEHLEHFSYAASHDLQEPLRKISLYSEMICNNELDNLSEISKTRLRKIMDASQRMTQALKDLLSYTSLDKKEDFEKVDLNVIVKEVCNDLELVILQNSAIITIEPLPVVYAIKLQMHQLFYNLINNALKFKAKDNVTSIRIECSLLKKNDGKPLTEFDQHKDYYEIVIKDNGIGFDSSNKEKIFQMFQRLHTKEEYVGTGMGLALCKKVIQNHDGEIWAESSLGNGAAFHIVLPVK